MVVNRYSIMGTINDNNLAGGLQSGENRNEETQKSSYHQESAQAANRTERQTENPLDRKPLTIGQKAVGLSFNPSGDPAVNFVKQSMADIIDLVEEKHSKDMDAKHGSSWLKNVFRTAAFNALITAQMAVVKYLTWND